jgi:hypothetical protein
MERVIFDIPHFIGISRQSLEEALGQPHTIVRISYVEEDWEITPTPFGNYGEIVDEATYDGLLKNDDLELSKSSLSFHIGIKSDKVKGISVILESEKFIYLPQKLMQVFGMPDAGKADEQLTELSNWWNYRGWTVNLYTIRGNSVFLMVYPSQLPNSTHSEG